MFVNGKCVGTLVDHMTIYNSNVSKKVMGLCSVIKCQTVKIFFFLQTIYHQFDGNPNGILRRAKNIPNQHIYCALLTFFVLFSHLLYINIIYVGH